MSNSKKYTRIRGYLRFGTPTVATPIYNIHLFSERLNSDERFRPDILVPWGINRHFKLDIYVVKDLCIQGRS